MADALALQRLANGSSDSLIGSRIEPLSHRGFWLHPKEKNTELAFRRSLDAGFGIETDVRDRNGQAVIAHDISEPGVLTLDAFFSLYKSYPARPMLALNIKADGLQDVVREQLQRHGIERYFVFDMSVPDLLGYRASGIRYFTRVSEYEKEPIAIDDADGVWVDQFEADWVDETALRPFIERDKSVCIVSPELHRRDPHKAWSNYRAMAKAMPSGKVFLCTDHPSQAREFFT